MPQMQTIHPLTTYTPTPQPPSSLLQASYPHILLPLWTHFTALSTSPPLPPFKKFGLLGSNFLL